VFHAWGQNNLTAAYGGASLGVDTGFLGQTGYVNIPLAWAPSTWSWYIVHEFNHQLDSMMNVSGVSDFQHADLPWLLSGDFGENYEFNAFFLRKITDIQWNQLVNSRYGNIVDVVDLDGDGVPDSGNFPITENLLGSKSNSKDSDNDGLSDLNEIMAGIFQGSNILSNDSDFDGIDDSHDVYPLYPISNQIKYMSITTKLDYNSYPSWIISPQASYYRSEFRQVAIGMTYNDSFLTVCVLFPLIFPKLQLNLDLLNDGWFHGADNLRLELNHSQTINVKTWVADNLTIAKFSVPMWDTDPLFRKSFSPIMQSSNISFIQYDSSSPMDFLIFSIPWHWTGQSALGFNVILSQIESKENLWLFEENVLIDVLL
jgi:hypothetical protein